MVLSSRERPFLIEPMGNGLRGVTLRFAHEVRNETDYFSDIPKMKLLAEMIELAQHIIGTKSGTFDPSMLEHHYRNALVRILRKKQTERPASPMPVKPLAENVVSLMDRSVAALRPSALPQYPHRGEAPQNLQPATQRAPAGPDEGEGNVGIIGHAARPSQDQQTRRRTFEIGPQAMD